jgi:hypothetical protein
MDHLAIHSALELAARQLDALATSLAQQAQIHAKLIDGPALIPRTDETSSG